MEQAFSKTLNLWENADCATQALDQVIISQKEYDSITNYIATKNYYHSCY